MDMRFKALVGWGVVLHVELRSSRSGDAYAMGTGSVQVTPDLLAEVCTLSHCPPHASIMPACLVLL